jgi:hypothetical protein
VRILFVFDPERGAVLLVAGDKSVGGRARTAGTSRLPRLVSSSGWTANAQRRSDMTRMGRTFERTPSAVAWWMKIA